MLPPLLRKNLQLSGLNKFLLICFLSPYYKKYQRAQEPYNSEQRVIQIVCVITILTSTVVLKECWIFFWNMKNLEMIDDIQKHLCFQHCIPFGLLLEFRRLRGQRWNSWKFRQISGRELRRLSRLKQVTNITKCQTKLLSQILMYPVHFLHRVSTPSFKPVTAARNHLNK